MYNEYILYHRISWAIGTIVSVVLLRLSIKMMKYCYKEWQKDRSDTPGWEIPMVISGALVVGCIFSIGICLDYSAKIWFAPKLYVLTDVLHHIFS